MRMLHGIQRSFKKKKPGKIIKAVSQRTGRVVTVRQYKNVPKNCSRPRQVCIVCLKNHVHKNEKNYDLKTCKGCLAGMPTEPASKKYDDFGKRIPKTVEKKITAPTFEPRVILRKKAEPAKE